MTTIKGRRTILTASLLAMLACLAILGAFTWKFAGLLRPVSLLACLGWLFFLVVMVWFVVLGRINSQYIPKYTGKRVVGFQPLAPVMIFGLAALSVVWMFYAKASPPQSLPEKLHWYIEFILAATAIALLVFRYSDYRDKANHEADDVVQENAGKREKLYADIKALQTSEWLESFGPGSVGRRLKAALNWWLEELAVAIPERGYALAERFVSHYLDDSRRLLNVIQNLHERREQSETPLVDAECRVLESINRAARINRRMSL